MRCEDIRELMSEHIDGVLDEAGEERLAGHLAGCEDCRLDLEALEETVSLVQELDTVEPPADLLQKIHARIERDREQKPGVVWSFLSMTQVRVAIAACFTAVLCIYGVRELTRNTKSYRELPLETDAAPMAGQEVSMAPDAANRIEPEAKRKQEAQEARRPTAGVSDIAVDRPAERPAKYRRKKLGWSAGQAPAEPAAAPGKIAARRYDSKAAAKTDPAATLKEADALVPPAPVAPPVPVKEPVTARRAEVDGAIWRERAAKKAKRQPAERAPAPVRAKAPARTGPEPVGVGAAAAEEAEQVEKIDGARALVDAEEMRARRASVRSDELKKGSARGAAATEPVDTVAQVPAAALRVGGGPQASGAAAPRVNMTVVTAKRAEVLAIVRKLGREKPVPRKNAAGRAAGERAVAADDAVLDALAVEKLHGRTVVEVRIPATDYAKLTAELKALGEVTVVGVPAADAADNRVSRAKTVGARDKREAAPAYLTVRLTIVDKQ